MVKYLFGGDFIAYNVKYEINNSYYNLFLVLRSCGGGANVLKYLFGGDFIAYNDKKQIITYEKYFHQTI